MENGKRGKEREKREMKTWVLVLILALGMGIFASQAGAQFVITNSNLSFTNSAQTMPGVPSTPTTANSVFSFTNPAQTTLGAPSIVETNPFFQSSFQSKTGVQAPTTTNGPLGIPSQNQLGAPSTVETNPFFGTSFESTTGALTGATAATATTNVQPGIPPAGNPSNSIIQQLVVPESGAGGSTNPISGAPLTPASAPNPLFGGSFQGTTGVPPQNVIGVQSGVTNFLFDSSASSWVGQGQSLFATPTNGYNVRLAGFSPDNLQFTITATNPVGTNWFLEFTTTNDYFTAGIYTNAVSGGGGPARLVFSGMGRGDNASDGAFKVLAAC